MKRWSGWQVAWVGMTLALPLGAVRGAEIRGMVVDSTGAGLGDAVVFVQELPPGAAAAPQARSAVMDQIHKEFVPHVLAVPVGTAVTFPNHDQIHHHVYSFSRTKTFEIPLYKGESAAPVVFDQPGTVKLGCNIHDWMSGVVVVLPTPYYAKTDASGAFALSDLPPGTYSLAVWHERATVPVDDTVQRVDVGGGAVPITFTLAVSRVQARSAVRGVRSYE